MIDLYCERLGPGFWAEPINALSNIGFLIAAWFAWVLANNQECLNGHIKLLIALIVSIGLGSFTFHTFATTWSMILDLVPILLFQLAFFGYYSQKVMAMKPFFSVLLLSFFVITVVIGKLFPQYINGSLLYLPTLLLLTAMGIFHCLHKKKESVLLLLVVTLFSLSLMFRSLDNEWCDQFPLGTHFLWHLSCGLAVYLLIRALIVNWPHAKKN